MHNFMSFSMNRRFIQTSAKGLLCVLILLSVLSFVRTELHHHLVEHEHHPSFLNFDQQFDIQAHVDAEPGENHLFHHVVLIFFFVVSPLITVYQGLLKRFLKTFLLKIWSQTIWPLKQLYLRQHTPYFDPPTHNPPSFFTQTIRLII